MNLSALGITPGGSHMNKTMVFLMLVVGILVTGGLVYAFGPGIGNNNAVNAAIQAGDYSAWKEAIISGLTEERFNQEVSRYNEMKIMQANREAMNTAIESGDYAAWKTLVKSGRKMDTSEEAFDKMVEMHKARKANNANVDSGYAKLGEGKKPEGFGMGDHGIGGFGRERHMGLETVTEAATE
jgi:hypothetical protein